MTPRSASTSSRSCNMDWGSSSAGGVDHAAVVRQVAIEVEEDYDDNSKIRNFARAALVASFYSDELILEPMKPTSRSSDEGDQTTNHIGTFFSLFSLRGISLGNSDCRDPPFTEEMESCRERFAGRSHNRHYTVKFINPQQLQLDPKGALDAASALVVEAKILMNLDKHPHICQIYGIHADGPGAGFANKNVVEKNFFVISDAIRETLPDRMKAWKKKEGYEGERYDELEKKHSEVTQRLEVALDVASAVTFLSNRKLVYFLHPEKVGFDSRRKRITLFDFGHAQESGRQPFFPYEENNMRRRVYLAPEVLRREKVLVDADVFAFGMLLWEILILKPPLHGLEQEQHMNDVVNGTTRPHLSKNLPNTLRLLMENCWAQSSRPTISHVHDQLEGLLLEGLQLPTEVVSDKQLTKPRSRRIKYTKENPVTSDDGKHDGTSPTKSKGESVGSKETWRSKDSASQSKRSKRPSHEPPKRSTSSFSSRRISYRREAASSIERDQDSKSAKSRERSKSQETRKSRDAKIAKSPETLKSQETRRSRDSKVAKSPETLKSQETRRSRDSKETERRPIVQDRKKRLDDHRKIKYERAKIDSSEERDRDTRSTRSKESDRSSKQSNGSREPSLRRLKSSSRTINGRSGDEKLMSFHRSPEAVGSVRSRSNDRNHGEARGSSSGGDDFHENRLQQTDNNAEKDSSSGRRGRDGRSFRSTSGDFLSPRGQSEERRGVSSEWQLRRHSSRRLNSQRQLFGDRETDNKLNDSPSFRSISNSQSLRRRSIVRESASPAAHNKSRPSPVSSRKIASSPSPSGANQMKNQSDISTRRPLSKMISSAIEGLVTGDPSRQTPVRSKSNVDSIFSSRTPPQNHMLDILRRRKSFAETTGSDNSVFPSRTPPQNHLTRRMSIAETTGLDNSVFPSRTPTQNHLTRRMSVAETTGLDNSVFPSRTPTQNHLTRRKSISETTGLDNMALSRAQLAREALANRQNVRGRSIEGSTDDNPDSNGGPPSSEMTSFFDIRRGSFRRDSPRTPVSDHEKHSKSPDQRNYAGGGDWGNFDDWEEDPTLDEGAKDLDGYFHRGRLRATASCGLIKASPRDTSEGRRSVRSQRTTDKKEQPDHFDQQSLSRHSSVRERQQSSSRTMKELNKPRAISYTTERSWRDLIGQRQTKPNRSMSTGGIKVKASP